MKQNWNVSKRNERRGRKMGKHTTMSGHDGGGEKHARGLKPLHGEKGNAFNPVQQSLLLCQQ